MSEFEKRQSRTDTRHLVSPAKPDQAMPKSVYAENPLMVQKQAVGNQTLQRLLRSWVMQAKLKTGQPGDKYEREADRVADQVMQMPEPEILRQPEEEDEKELIQTKTIAGQINPMVQRQADEEAENEEEEEEFVQTKRMTNKALEVTPFMVEKISEMRGSGKPLTQSNRAFFEPRFGYNFSQIKVHTGRLATELAHKLNARAFTLGHDVFFGDGQYYPEVKSGRRLIAHELMHVVQQTKARGEKFESIKMDSKRYKLGKYRPVLGLEGQIIRLTSNEELISTKFRYEPGEKKASETSKMVVEQVASDTWIVYDFQVGSAKLDSSKIDTVILDPILKVLNAPAFPKRERPGIDSPGGLLKKPKLLPRVKVIGGTDAVGSLERNVKLRRARAINFIRSFFSKSLVSRTKIFDMDVRWTLYPNDSRYNRARNRNVMIVNMGAPLWTIEQQLEQAKKESGKIFQRAIKKIRLQSGFRGPKASEERGKAMLKLLLDPSVDDRYYDKSGVNNYILDNLYNKGFLPGSEESGVKHARKKLIRYIVDAKSIDDIIRRALQIGDAMNEGWFRAQSHPLRSADRNAQKIHKWIMEEQKNPKSVNYVAKLIE